MQIDTVVGARREPEPLEAGTRVAVIDLQVFVPEVVSVLSTVADPALSEHLKQIPFGRALIGTARDAAALDRRAALHAADDASQDPEQEYEHLFRALGRISRSVSNAANTKGISTGRASRLRGARDERDRALGEAAAPDASRARQRARGARSRRQPLRRASPEYLTSPKRKRVSPTSEFFFPRARILSRCIVSRQARNWRHSRPRSLRRSTARRVRRARARATWACS